MKCPKCGAEILQGHWYCSACDYKLTPAEYREGNKKKGGRIIAIVVAVLVIGGVAALWPKLPIGDLLGRGNERPAPTEALHVDAEPTPEAGDEEPTGGDTSQSTPVSSGDFVPFPLRYGFSMDMPEEINSSIDLIKAVIVMRERGDSKFKTSKNNLNSLLLDAAMNEVTDSFADMEHLEYSYLGKDLTVNITWKPSIRIWQAVTFGRENTLSADDADMLSRAREALDQFVLPVMTDLEKERTIHDYLCRNAEYLIDESLETGSLYGLFRNGKAQCAGYSDAFQLMCRLEGIWTCQVSGDAMDGDLDMTNGDTSHGWNLIYLDGTWYMVDVTWDDEKDGSITYVYFNVPKNVFYSTRTYNLSTLPEGNYASELDEKWGCWDLPYLDDASAAAKTIADGLRSTGDITVRLSTDIDTDSLSDRVVRQYNGRFQYSELLNADWAKIVRFEAIG